MTATVLIPLRNKAQWIERAVRSAINQTHPCEVIVFDQASSDGGDAIVEQIFSDLGNPKSLRFLRCPSHPMAGTAAGVCADFDWVHEQATGQVHLFCSADDHCHPERVRRVMEVWEQQKPSWICTAQLLSREGETPHARSHFAGCRTGFIGIAEGIRGLVGSSGAFSWDRDFYEKYRPMRGIEANDVVLSSMAYFERGLYYIDEPLHTMMLHDDLNNVGLEGQVRGARDDAERAQLIELNNFHNAYNWLSVIRRIVEKGFRERMTADEIQAFDEKVIGAAGSWAWAREYLTTNKIAPLPFGGRAMGMVDG